MSKFKVGDKVRVLDGSKIENYTAGWSTFGMQKHIGEVHTIKSIDREWSDERVSYELDDLICAWDERGLELVSKFKYEDSADQKIVITTDGKTTTAVLYDGKKRIKDAKATCAPTDTFDFGIGSALAIERLVGNPKATLSEENSDWDKFIAGEIAFEMTSDNYDAFLKEVEKRFPNLHWCTGQKPTGWKPSLKNKCYFVTKDGKLYWDDISDVECVQWTDKSGFDWNKFAHGKLEVKVNKEKFDEFMKLCEERNFKWAFDNAATNFNPWKLWNEMPDFLKTLMSFVDNDEPGDHVYIAFTSDEHLGFSWKHDEDLDEYEFV